MLYPGGYEQNVTDFEPVPLVGIAKQPATLHYGVHFVPAMRGLGIVLAGGVKLYAQSAVPEELDKALTLGTREPGEAFTGGELMPWHQSG